MMAEWASVMRDGPGIVVLRGAFADLAPVDAATESFSPSSTSSGARTRRAATISPSRAPTTGSGTRWKSWPCARPSASRAITPTRRSRWSRRPGSGPAIRSPRRSIASIPAARRNRRIATITWASRRAEEIAGFPAHAHQLSPLLTLQGAVAHCDMPIESGPTLYLPFSQTLRAGLFRLAQARIRRLFRRALRPAAARKGRRRVLQSGPVPRRRPQPHARTCAASPTSCRSPRPMAARWNRSIAREWPRRSIPRCAPASPSSARAVRQRRSPPAPRATPSPPTSTATRRSAASRRRARRR